VICSRRANRIPSSSNKVRKTAEGKSLFAQVKQREAFLVYLPLTKQSGVNDTGASRVTATSAINSPIAIDVDEHPSMARSMAHFITHRAIDNS